MDKSYFDRYVIDGGILMFLLIPCAFLALAYIIQSVINLRRSKIVPKFILKEIKSVSSEESAYEVIDKIKKSNSPIANIFIEWRGKNKGLSIKDSDLLLKEITDNEISRIYHKNNQLLTIYQVAPLLGLLGTVIGMMKSFYQFSMEKQHSLEMLSRGINEALITTMWGLSIAIPAFIALHFIKQKLFKYEYHILPRIIMDMSSELDKYINKNNEDKDNKNTEIKKEEI